MDNRANLLDPLIERVEEFGKTSYELIKLKTLDKSSDMIAGFISRFMMFFILFMAVIVADIGLAFYLGEQMGKMHYGFFAVAGINLIVGLIIFGMHNLIKASIANSIISKMLD